eukprot:TRINITY_DN11367_c0_g4_i1.p1 TRINITY_DN11367_c0_g4~~TRINITY_DN11367_c0_g4_i1.p1  ORF type:complete len:422 (-),score=128.68 TRINITY_DN11367_c0_g4_i1:142-1347(-)
MSSSSSSSSSESAKKQKKKKDKKKKDKKSKKDKSKKQKKQKKEAKQRKRAERAEDWQCDRAEGVRLVRQLLELDNNVAEELGPVFEALDEGETVNIDGLENKHVKKKLRHLLQALRLHAVDGKGFKTADPGVSFTSLFESVVKEARKSLKGGQQVVCNVDAPVAPAPAVVRAPEPPPAVAAVPDPAPEETPPVEQAPAAAPAKRRRTVGPQRPMPGIEAVEDEEESKSEDEFQGPRDAQSERKGVDLDSLDYEGPKREQWMTMHGDALGGVFGDAAGGRDCFEVGRSKEERAAFEEAYKKRGPSLLQQTQEGAFKDAKELQENAKKRKVGADIWGVAAAEQSSASAAASSKGPEVRRPFDPEQDMQTSRPISADAFQKLVENSGAGLAGRFGRSQVATCFL